MVNAQLLTAVMVNSLCTSFIVALQMSAFNEPVKILQEFVNRSYTATNRVTIQSANQLWTIWSFIIGSFMVGQLVGALLVPYFADRLGRKTSLMVHNNFFAISGSCCLFLAKAMMRYELLIFGRFLLGISGSLGGGLLSMYLIECSPAGNRGMIGSIQNLSIATCSFIGSLLSLDSALGTERLWPFLISLTAVSSLLQLAFSSWLPETPSYLYLQKNEIILAEKSFEFYRGPHVNANEEFEQLDKNYQLCLNQPSYRQIFQSKLLRKAAILAISLPLAALSTGIIAVSNYSTEMFRNASANEKLSQWSSALIACFNMIGGIIAVTCIEKFGRKPLVLFGLWTTACCSIIFIISDQASQKYESKAWFCVAVASLIFHVVAFNLGPGPVAWFYTSEITNQAERSKCTSLSMISSSISALVQNMLVPQLLSTCSSLAFMIFIIPSMAMAIFLGVYMIETKSQDNVDKNKNCRPPIKPSLKEQLLAYEELPLLLVDLNDADSSDYEYASDDGNITSC